MKLALLFLGAVALLLGGGCASEKQAQQVYEHPSLNIQFAASFGWEQVPRPGEADVYEVVNPQSGVHVILWKTETEQDAPGYLVKMADMKGLAPDAEPEERSIGTRQAWVLDTTGSEGDAAIHTLLAVIPHGRVSSRPKEHVLFIVQAWCLEDDWSRHERSMWDVLNSVEIVD